MVKFPVEIWVNAKDLLERYTVSGQIAWCNETNELFFIQKACAGRRFKLIRESDALEAGLLPGGLKRSLH